MLLTDVAPRSSVASCSLQLRSALPKPCKSTQSPSPLPRNSWGEYLLYDTHRGLQDQYNGSWRRQLSLRPLLAYRHADAHLRQYCSVLGELQLHAFRRLHLVGEVMAHSQTMRRLSPRASLGTGARCPLGPGLKHHIEWSFSRPADSAEASCTQDVPKPGLSGLSAERRTDFLVE